MDSLPVKFRPLPNRLNIVMTRNKNLEFPKGVLVINNFQSIPWDKIKGKLFIIGGASIYNLALKNCTRIYITKIYKNYNCDKFFPNFLDKFELEKQ